MSNINYKLLKANYDRELDSRYRILKKNSINLSIIVDNNYYAVIPPIYSEIVYVSPNLIGVKNQDDNEWNVIDIKNNHIAGPFLGVTLFPDNICDEKSTKIEALIVTSINNKKGVLTNKRGLVVNTLYDKFESVFNNHYVGIVSGFEGYSDIYNLDFKKIYSAKNTGFFRYDRIPVQSKETLKWNYINGNGEVVIAGEYEFAETFFYDGFANVMVGTSKILIDLDGEPYQVKVLSFEKATKRKAGVIV